MRSDDIPRGLQRHTTVRQVTSEPLLTGPNRADEDYSGTPHGLRNQATIVEARRTEENPRDLKMSRPVRVLSERLMTRGFEPTVGRLMENVRLERLLASSVRSRSDCGICRAHFVAHCRSSAS